MYYPRTADLLSYQNESHNSGKRLFVIPFDEFCLSPAKFAGEFTPIKITKEREETRHYRLRKDGAAN